MLDVPLLRLFCTRNAIARLRQRATELRVGVPPEQYLMILGDADRALQDRILPLKSEKNQELDNRIARLFEAVIAREGAGASRRLRPFLHTSGKRTLAMIKDARQFLRELHEEISEQTQGGEESDPVLRQAEIEARAAKDTLRAEAQRKVEARELPEALEADSLWRAGQPGDQHYLGFADGLIAVVQLMVRWGIDPVISGAGTMRENASGLANGQPFPSLGSRDKPAQNADGSTDLYLGPSAPSGKEGNWIATVPGRGYFAIIRLYGPTEPALNKSWKPSDVEKVK